MVIGIFTRVTLRMPLIELKLLALLVCIVIRVAQSSVYIILSNGGGGEERNNLQEDVSRITQPWNGSKQLYIATEKLCRISFAEGLLG
jgi:hypothetical protein